ncbi:uncharacterized protein zgc:193801 [Trichomycterus rosablanca]|uniref:uncharacterized protein zgc:193801 n=1 Tax=Trichomycterus rosablanca TaxID=2290929 RepID=UPI002F352DAA
MATFVAHPSVQVKGSEHSYVPVLCQDDKCTGHEKGVHMHCPLCTVGEAYQDPIILRAHFRIKHVDKSIDFAGLKVLRCCNHCEIVGTIKGEKRFKGAHWHCYRCRNGFNRRDEAVKHYKTHFRNPHTTFQIQVTQDVNCRQYYSSSAEANAKSYSGLAVSLGSVGDATSATNSIVTQPILATTGTETTALLTVEPKEDCESNGMPVGAEEEVESSLNGSEQAQTLVLMDPDGKTSNLIYDEATAIVTEQRGDSLELQKRLLELNEQIDALRQEKESVEKSLRAEIKQLKEQVASLVQANVKMFDELQLCQCQDHSQQRLAKMVESLQAQHKELLEAQLASLRQEFLSQPSAVLLNDRTQGPNSSQDRAQDQVEVQGAIVSGIRGLEIISVQLQPEHEELREQLVEFETSQDDALAGVKGSKSDPALQSTEVEVKEEEEVPPVNRKRSSEEDCAGTSESKLQRVS